jgi:hypothetical protein
VIFQRPQGGETVDELTNRFAAAERRIAELEERAQSTAAVQAEVLRWCSELETAVEAICPRIVPTHARPHLGDRDAHPTGFGSVR